MIKYVEVFIKSKYPEHALLIDALRGFSNDNEHWKYLEPQSSEYARNTGSPSCALALTTYKHYPAVAITHKSNNTFYIANIVPKESGGIDTSEYNEIARIFVKDLRGYIKKYKVKASIEITSDKVSLSTIITGSKAHELFQRYINLHPLSYHPNDIERLDIFICHLSRHAKKTFDTEALGAWLMNEKDWKQKDAEWCTNRINIGLDVLEVNRNM